MKSLFISGLVLAILCGFSAVGQVTIGEFIKSASNDYEVRSFADQLNYLQGKPYRLSPLQRLEFRTQNRELDAQQQEYALRFNPANPWEVRNNNRYFKSFESALRIEKEMEFKQALTSRYFQIIEFLYYLELRDVTNENQKLANDQLSILERQLGSSFFDADEYVKLRLDVLERSVKIEETDFEINNVRNEAERLYPAIFGKQLGWDYKTIIPVVSMQAVVDSFAVRSAASTWINYQQQKIDLASSEYKLEKSNISVGFLQTEYDRRRVNQDRTPVNINLGITIPIVNPNKGDMAKRKLEMIEANYDLEEAKQEEKLDLMILQEKLKQLFLRYNNLNRKITDLEKSDLAENLQNIKGGDPLIVVEFNSNILKLKTLLIKLKREILITYIRYVGFTDQLQQQPLRNFLSPSLQQIE